MRSGVVVFGVIVLVAACSDEKTAEEIAVEDNSALLCERLFSCCSPEELDALPFIAEERPPTQEGCVAYHNKTGHDYLPAVTGEEKAGHISIDVNASSDCIARLREESCSDFSRRLLDFRLADVFALCNSAIITPHRTPGEPCGLYLACEDGYCDEGTCKALPKSGQPCREDPGCVAGLRCNSRGVCEAYVGTGGPCEEDSACTSGICDEGRCVSPGRCGGS